MADSPSNWKLATVTCAERAAPHVLIIDRDSLLRWCVNESLAASGCLVSEAADGLGAMTILTGHTPPDVAVIDSDLDDVDGLTLLGAFHELLPACSTILLTTDAAPDLADRARQAGASLVLEKPFGMTEIVAAVLRVGRVLQRASPRHVEVQSDDDSGTNGAVAAPATWRPAPITQETAMSAVLQADLDCDPLDIGMKGRRARAFLSGHGLVVSATDRDVAAHATAVVLEAVHQFEGLLDQRFKQWTAEILRHFPEAPGALTEVCAGDPGQDVEAEIIGIGYVRPRGAGHECGGLLFDPATHGVHRVAPQTIWVGQGATPN
jgi:CheY-like chemotaxis protein